MAVEYIRRGGGKHSSILHAPRTNFFLVQVSLPRSRSLSSSPWTSTGVSPASVNLYVFTHVLYPRVPLTLLPSHSRTSPPLPVHTALHNVSPTLNHPRPYTYIIPHSPHPGLVPITSASGLRRFHLTSLPGHPLNPLRISLLLHPPPSVPPHPAHVTSPPQSLSSVQPRPHLSPPFASRPPYDQPSPHEPRPTPIHDPTRLPA